MVEILDYSQERDYESILESLKQEQWQSFYEERKQEYVDALKKSQTFVLYEDGKFAGFVRGITDGCFTLFIPEIIVNSEYRRKGYGRMLIEHIKQRNPKTRIELISDSDDFYLAQGFHTVGNGMRKHDWYL